MAHVMKIKAQGLAPMAAHYARTPELRGYRRGNIDPARTADNYAIGADDADALAREVVARVKAAEERHKEVSGRSVRRDADLLADWVVTLPEDCPDKLQGKFFAAVFGFVRDRYGAECCPGAFVHLDESRPHAHIPVIPILADGRLNATKKIDRNDLITFHKDLSACLDKELGRHVSVVLDPEDRATRALSDVKDREALTIMRTRADHDRDVAAAARREAARAGRDMVAAQDRATRAREDAARARADAQEARGEAARAREEAARAKADAQEARAQADAAKAQETAARDAAREARTREQAARKSEAEARRAADAARDDAERAREEAKSARHEADKARADAARAKDELAGLRDQLAAVKTQLAAARQELARVRGEIDQILSRAKASFRTWWRGIREEPDIDRMAAEAARAMADALREAGFGDRDEPCR